MGSIRIPTAERKLALKRTKAFLVEFSAKPEPNILLNCWYLKDGSQYFENKRHCGSVGCVVGYVNASPLMKAFCDTYPETWSPYYEGLDAHAYRFFGLTFAQVQKFKLFDAKHDFKLSDKAEGIQRLKNVIAFHKKQLAKV